jgi:transposase
MGTTTELEELKAELGAAPRNKQGYRQYSDTLKRAVTQYARRRLRSGTESQHGVAREIGISADTLWSWLHGSEAGETRRHRKEVGRPGRAREFRTALRALGERGPTTPYPPELRALGLSHLKERQAAGASLREVASELGIGNDTLRRWTRRRERTRAAVRPVRLAIRAESTMPVSAGTFLVHGPAGLRIDGLDLATVVALWKALS